MDYTTQQIQVGNKTFPCSTSLAMAFIGGKWKSVILYHLLSGEKRYSELRRLAPAITERTLSLQLKQLEKDGLVIRQVFTQKPPLKVTYRLTPFGETVGPVIDAIREWGNYVLAERGEVVGCD